MTDARDFLPLEAFLQSVPALQLPLGRGFEEDGRWWVKFSIDTKHDLAWRVVQELAYVLNYLSVNERLPTIFKPLSPPPYLNGGPGEFLSWVIECSDAAFTPGTAAKWLEGRLPQPVDDLEQWKIED